MKYLLICTCCDITTSSFQLLSVALIPSSVWGVIASANLPLTAILSVIILGRKLNLQEKIGLSTVINKI